MLGIFRVMGRIAFKVLDGAVPNQFEEGNPRLGQWIGRGVTRIQLVNDPVFADSSQVPLSLWRFCGHIRAPRMEHMSENRLVGILQ